MIYICGPWLWLKLLPGNSSTFPVCSTDPSLNKGLLNKKLGMCDVVSSTDRRCSISFFTLVQYCACTDIIHRESMDCPSTYLETFLLLENMWQVLRNRFYLLLLVNRHEQQDKSSAILGIKNKDAIMQV